MMASGGGLSRRRINAGSVSTQISNGDADHPKGSITPKSPVPRSDSGRALYSPVIGRDDDHKVAFDPRDLDQGIERSQKPVLTLMEEILLLGLKDKQGYLSFWNDNISYTLRGCIIMELALRGRISMQRDSNRRRYPLADRLVEVVDDKLTGEVLLDEALKMMKNSDKMSVGTWVDLMSGETWNLMKIGYQLKQVRERLAKGLVDKGILRTEKKNFLLFDMPTHPIADTAAKDDIRRRVISMLTQRTVILHDTPYLPESIPFRNIRTVALVCTAYAANVLENALTNIGHESRERAFSKVDEMLGDFSQWPFAPKGASGGLGIASNLPNLIQEEVSDNRDKELQLEIIAAVLQVFTRLDSIL